YTFYGLQLSNLPVFKENEEQAGNQVTFLDQHTDPSALFLNMTYDDPVWREVVQDLRFRQALSLAINRQEIIDSVYYGFATLPLRTVGEEFSQHDPERANALLDEMGLTERDDEGFRLR